jgi:hypothetical protein
VICDFQIAENMENINSEAGSPKGNATVRLSPARYQWLLDEQERIRRSTGKRPKINKLVDGLLVAGIGISMRKNQTTSDNRKDLPESSCFSARSAINGDILLDSDSPLSDVERECLGKALRILRSGTQLTRSLVENFDGFILGLDAMEEVKRLREAMRERAGNPDASAPPDPNAGEPGGIKRLAADAESIGRSIDEIAKPRKRIQKKQG